MKDTVSNSKLALRSRFTEKHERPVNLSDWINGSEREFFYIICKDIRRTVLRKRHYLCVFKPSSRDGLDEREYVTGCRFREDHDQPDTHMLFSLIKPRKPKLCLDEEETSGDDDQSDLTPTEGPTDEISEGGDPSHPAPSETPKDKIGEEGIYRVISLL